MGKEVLCELCGPTRWQRVASVDGLVACAKCRLVYAAPVDPQPAPRPRNLPPAPPALSRYGPDVPCAPRDSDAGPASRVTPGLPPRAGPAFTIYSAAAPSSPAPSAASEPTSLDGCSPPAC